MNSGTAPDLGDLVELEITDERIGSICGFGFYRDTAQLLPDVAAWCCDNLQGGCIVELRWWGLDLQAGAPGVRFVAVLTCVEDAALFRLFWL